MTRDLFVEPARKPPAPGRLVVTGVVGACLLGAGLGVWARPAAPGEPGQRAAAKTPPKVDPARPALQIVVEDAPAPVGGKLEVLPADVRAAETAPPAPLVVEPTAPRPGASGLVKVDAVVLAAPEPVLAVHAPPPKPQAEPRKMLTVVIPEPPRPDPKVAKARIEKAGIAEARIAEAKLAKARAAEARAHKAAVLARAEQLEQAKAAKLAKAEQLEKAAKLEKAKAAKLAKAEARRERSATKLVKAGTPPKVEKARVEKAKTEAKAKRLPGLLKAVKTQPRPVARPKVVKVAAPAPKAPAPPARKPAPKPPVLRGSGPMRVARANPCASPDPGEAAVCADQRLGARDRQLQQAYRNAEAAGVPPSALRDQQARWLQARAAAAREAPWAVEDVYVARISELKDQTRDAREN